MKFNWRFKPSRLVPELVAQHTAVGLGREFKPSDFIRLTAKQPVSEPMLRTVRDPIGIG
jgi:hypothetical protein